MEWLSNLLGMTGGGTAPFGALGGGAATPAASGGAVTGAPAMGGAGAGVPGLLGMLLGKQQQQGPYSGFSGALNSMGANINPQSGNVSMQGGSGGTGINNQLLSQALKLMQPQQMAPPPQMKLLTGPGPGGA